MSENPELTEQQKQYLAGFAVGSGLNAPAPRQVESQGEIRSEGESEPIGPDAIHVRAQDRFTASGKKLVKEEKAKREKNPLDMGDEIARRAEAGEFPSGTDVFLMKSIGLFYVAPAQDAYMCRLRLAAGLIDARQMRGVADLAERHGGGYSHVTTRANLQIREIPAASGPEVLTGLADLGILNRGAGADNIRNVTASPTAGIDPRELYDTRELAKRMHHTILWNRWMYNLPRKFNVAFDGGGTVSALAETNDVGFAAVGVDESEATDEVPAGVYFRLQLGGITGHGDFAADAGLLLAPEECVPVARAVIEVFVEHGDRTDRGKARLKYLLDAWGRDAFVKEACERLDFAPRFFPLERCAERPEPDPWAHVGVHPQRDEAKRYLGVVLPVGRMEAEQMRALAAIAERFGSGTLRLTCWQNVIVSDVDADAVADAKVAIEAAGLTTDAHGVRAGLVACTGNGGCKFSACDTKGHARAVADHVEQRLELDTPVNIHLTGCPNSCAQHHIGDIGLLGTKVDPSGGADDDAEEVEGYRVLVGGGHGTEAGLGRELFAAVTADELPELVEQMIRQYLEHRNDASQTFRDFARERDVDTLAALFSRRAETAGG